MAAAPSAACSICAIFGEDGEAAFRQIERQVVEDLARLKATVIATGGGLGANRENLTSLKRHALVTCLWATADAIWHRVHNQTHRPLLRTADPLQTIRSLLAERMPIYKQADVLVNTEMRSAKEVVQHVLHAFYLARQPGICR